MLRCTHCDCLFYCIKLNFFSVGFEQAYTQKYSSWFTHLECNKTQCFGFSVGSQGISPPFLPQLPTLYWGSEPPVWADAVLRYSFAPLPLVSLSSPTPLLSKTAAERKRELPRLYLPPKPTYRATSFASLLSYLVVSITQITFGLIRQKSSIHFYFKGLQFCKNY